MSRNVLDGKTEWVKLDSHIVFVSKRTYRNQILDQRRNQNLIQKKRGTISGNSSRCNMSNREEIAIADRS